MKMKNLDKLLSPARLSEADWSDLRRIRRESQELGSVSQTSEKYQDDILDAVYKSAYNGGHIIELGIFRGGLSCQLAYLSKILGVDCILVDISQEYCDITIHLLRQLDLLHERVRVLAGTVHDLFIQYNCIYGPPAAIVVDALHTYNGVRIDICNILAQAPSVPVIGFHDWALRSDLALRRQSGIAHHVNGVSNAVMDVIGDSDALHPIGMMGEGKVSIGAESYDYMEEGYPEGMLLFPELLDRMAFNIALSFCGCFPPDRACEMQFYAGVQNTFQNSRWIRLGIKLGFLKETSRYH